MKGKLKCGYCEKSKPVGSFSLKWQLRNRVCNYCASFKSVGVYANTDIKKAVVVKPCLRCDKEFINQSKANRICTACKDKDGYRAGSIFAHMQTGLVG